MLLLHSAGCAVGEARLPAERVEALVGLRCAARTARDYAAADALKIELEAGGVKLQDEVDGSTSWRYKLLQPRMGGGSRMMELARRAVDEHEHEHTLISISTDALALCLGDEPLLGRTAADAAFEFALAGSASSELIDALAEAQSLEFRRWKKPQPLVTMQVCERLAASGIADTSPIFDHAVSVLRTGGEECSHAMRSVQELSFEHPRSLRWLWRRAAVLRKELPPTNEVGHGSLHVALNAFSKPELPLVVDLGCGFGTSLLSLSRPRQAIGAAHAPVLGRYNLLGCDASSLKTAYANGAARRWGTFESTQFARASAEMTLASAFSSLASRLAGVVVQFPTPFRVDGGGNSQLPRLNAHDGSEQQYMLSASLLNEVAVALRDSKGWFFFQSNVEDVACVARTMTEQTGMELVATDAAASKAVSDHQLVRAPTLAYDGANKLSRLGSDRSIRRARLEKMGVKICTDASGPGWLSRNPLGVLSETEASLELDGRRIFRFLALPSSQSIIV